MNKISHYIMVAEVQNQQKLTRANSLKEKKPTKASLDHAAARVVKNNKFPGGQNSSVPPTTPLFWSSTLGGLFELTQ